MTLTHRFEEALVFAAQLHRDQKRKGSETPYVGHLLAVSAIVIEHGGDENQAIAALLHDAIEDQGGDPTRQEIERRFGTDVVFLVNGCTDTDITPKPPWRARKEAYVVHLRETTPRVRFVSAADKLHNIRSILTDYRTLGDDLWPRFRAGKDGTLWYYRTVLNTLLACESNTLFAELELAVKELEALAQSTSSNHTR
ncbi:MAG: HD domain-containing protein [Blastocatellia bacterium]|nr:HD domain-containing protein [Blastocatellia bacterium]